jgi:proteic killer suppression protein
LHHYKNMIVTFDKEYLKELYESGKSKDKKHRFQPEIVKRYKRCIDYLKWASSKEALFPINSLRFEALEGDKRGMFSVSVNDKYRIEFTLNETAEESSLTICNIVELSNHYD